MKRYSIIILALLAFVVGEPRVEADDCGGCASRRGGWCCRQAVPMACCYWGNCWLGNDVRYAYYLPNGPEARAQIILSRMGYYDGEIDGEIGPVSRRAIRRYQIMSGLPVTGTVDGPLLRSMGIIR